MYKHKLLGLLVALSLVLGLAGSALASQPEPLLLNLNELAKYNGKDGQPAYVAVDGVIYDMTNSLPWKNGEHNGFMAGKDLTKEIKEVSPHGVMKLDNVPVVGRLLLDLTLEELKAFNGKDGQPAYVAVEGLVYDMTSSLPWKDGTHNGFNAGNDLTKEIKEISPHGVMKLDNVPVVGRLVLKLSLEQLKEFDGKDGRKAYVAVNGFIYDVSEHPVWGSGSHAGYEAGTDITKGFLAVHSMDYLMDVPLVGIVVE